MNSLPTGTVTFLLTDLEGSTPLHEQYPEAMQKALPRHDALAAECIARNHGVWLKDRGEGDSLFTVFEKATDAVAAALDLQRALLAEPWPEPIRLRVRMALHTGEAEPSDNDYRGPTPNRSARLRDIAHGGQIILSQTTYDLLIKSRLPEGCDVKNLGEHRLRDVGTEHVWQLLHPDLPSRFPPLKSLDVLPNNLPQTLTSFIGRERELEQIEQAMLESRLLTLHGAGGCGKTRLALEVAARVQEAKRGGSQAGLFKEGVWLVMLEKLSDADRIAQEIATALGVRETAHSDLTSDLINSLQAKSLLLILDNCEHLREACAFLAERLLLACPSLRILATSRDALHIDAETLYPVPPLEVPDPDHLPPLEELAQQEAIRLFVERARAVKRGFALTAQNAPLIAKICRRLDGLPFAIELVAAQVNSNTIPEIEKDLYAMLAEIDGSETAHDRHRTFEALMDWSFRLLQSEELQILMRRLSVFAGGWDLDAAKSVCSGSDLRDFRIRKLLNRLAQASLIISETQNDTTRYRLLETARAYARRRLEESGETEAVQDRHIEYYLGLAEGQESYLNRKEQTEALARLDTEHDNLRAALNLTVNNETRLRLAGALWRFWAMRSYFSEGRARLQQALMHSRGVTPLAHAKALLGLGVLSLRQGDYTKAKPFVEESLRIYQNNDYLHGSAEAFNHLGAIAQQERDFSVALNHFETSLKLYEELRDSWGIASVYGSLGNLVRLQDDLPQARSYYEKSNKIYRDHEDPSRIASTLIHLAIISNDLRDYPSARPLLEESMALSRKQQDRFLLSYALFNLAVTLYMLEGPDAALQLYLECLALRRELGDKIGMIYVLWNLGQTYIGTDKPERAAYFLSASEHLRKEYNIPLRPSEYDSHAEAIIQLRAILDKQTFDTAWTAGSNMNLDEAVAFALQTPAA